MFDIPTPELRLRRSAKWSTTPDDVLPMHVAEMDVRPAEPIGHVLHEAIARGDTGYAGDSTDLTQAFASFAARRWGWDPDQGLIRLCADVAAGGTELLRVLVNPNDPVIITPPVYPPFRQWIEAARARPVEAPLLPPERGGGLDLGLIERLMQGGVGVILLCHPHNPTGRIHKPDELRQLAALADRHDATVISDEILAPLALGLRQFAPYLAVSPAAARTGIALQSASKAWNLAGLKSALLIAGDRKRHSRLLEHLPHELPWSAGHLGVLASKVAYAEGEQWLDVLRASVASNFELLASEISTRLPGVEWTSPDAGFVAWLNVSSMRLGPDPARRMLESARVAVLGGEDFGTGGESHVRMNIACAPELLAEAIQRLATL